MLESIIKPISKILFVCLILFAILFFNINSNYHENIFRIVFDGKEIYAAYDQKYRRVVIPALMDANNGDEGTTVVEPVVNQIRYSNHFILDIKEYAVYWKDTKDRPYSVPYWDFGKKYDYKEVKIDDARLIIKRKSKILYDGAYIKDVSEYVNEPGRYFFQAYVYRHDNFYTTLTTHFSFNVIVDGDGNE